MEMETVAAKYRSLAGALTERSRRLWAATEAKALGHGGIGLVERATGISRSTIQRGLRELESGKALTGGPERARRPGGGRLPTVIKDPALLDDLDALIEPTAAGEPDSPLRWTVKSVRNLSDALRGMGHEVSHTVVAELLHELGYSLQANQKKREGAQHADRDAQFHYINNQMRRALRKGEPAISVDTKKKELVGDFKNGGRELQPKGRPERVRVHDFQIPALGKAAPYGVYDIGSNAAWVSVGIDHDTSTFAVESIRRWWHLMGHLTYAKAKHLLITADSGGSNGARVRLWKVELQKLADETGLEITVCHLPPGTSKWNKIEHRLFSFISQNWRGKPLISHEVIVQLIAATTTQHGLKVRSQLDTNTYPAGVKISKKEMAALNLHRDPFHGEWNYSIHPHAPS